MDLSSELTRRCDDKSARSIGSAASAEQVLKNGQDERGRLAGACLCESENVAPLEGGGNRLDLNGSRLFVAGADDGLAELGKKVELIECVGRFGARSLLRNVVSLFDVSPRLLRGQTPLISSHTTAVGTIGAYGANP